MCIRDRRESEKRGVRVHAHKVFRGDTAAEHGEGNGNHELCQLHQHHRKNARPHKIGLAHGQQRRELDVPVLPPRQDVYKRQCSPSFITAAHSNVWRWRCWPEGRRRRVWVRW